jgi:hypothetical protein
VHWAGGHCTRTRITRPVARLEQLSYYPQLLSRVAALHEQGVGCRDIAQQLNVEGWRPAKRRETFNAPMVSSLLARQGLRSGSPKQRHGADLPDAPDEWLLADLAFELDMPSVTLFSWIRKGWVRARKVDQSGRSLWLIWADSAECERLRARRAAAQRWSRHVRVDETLQSSN